MAETPIKKAFVVGHPIAHSRSPMIHGHWLQTLGINGSYERIDVAPQDFEAFLKNLAESGFSGGNVTIPHKEVAFQLVDKRDEAAELIGAVNTIWFDGNNIVGGNTDASGFSANLDHYMKDEWRKVSSALVLGAGGASRAILFALKQAGIKEIRLVNRTLERARELADRFGESISVHGWNEIDEVSSDVGLVVNTTSLGMNGDGGNAINVSQLPETAIVTDIVYTPLQTPLLAAAAKRGLRTVDGLGMLLHQAAPGFEKWFGKRPQVTVELRALIVADLGSKA